MTDKGGVQKKKKVVILLKPMQGDGREITPNLFIFFHGPNSSKSAKKFFLLGG